MGPILVLLVVIFEGTKVQTDYYPHKFNKKVDYEQAKMVQTFYICGQLVGRLQEICIQI